MERGIFSPLEYDDPSRQVRIKRLASHVMFENVMSAADGAEGNERLIKREEQLALVRSLYPLIMGEVES